MMNLEQLFCEYADQFSAADSIHANECILMNGFAAMYKKTKDLRYFDLVKTYVNERLPKRLAGSYELAGLLRFLYEETKEETYQIAMGQMAAELSASGTNEEGIFVKRDGSRYSAQELYLLGAFFAWYDTNFNKKENYLVIMSQLRFITSHLLDDCKTDIIVKEYLMMMLAETVDSMSEEIYEHYARIKSWLKEAVHSTLNDETINKAMMAYVLFRGSNNKSLLAEKYLPAACEMLNEAACQLSKETFDQMNYADAGTLMMAYAINPIK